MQSFFKTKTITVQGVDLTLRELGAEDHRKIFGSDAEIEENKIAPLLCKACVVEWKDETCESITANIPLRLLREIGTAVLELSGISDAKNSEPTQVVVSSSG